MTTSGILTIGTYSAVQQSGPASSAFFVVSFTPQVVNVLAADSLVVDGLVFVDGTLTLDPAGVLEVGTAGTASAGTVTVDPGASLVISNGFTPEIGPGVYQGATFTTDPTRTLIASGVLNNGTISGAIALTNVVNTGTITDGTMVDLNSNTGTILASVVTGGTNLGTIIGGTINALVNDGVILGGTVADISGTGTLAVDPSADDDTLTIGAGVSDPVIFDDNAGMLVVQVDSASPANTPLIEGFTQGDQIFLSGVTAATASYAATGPSLGTLTISSNDTAIASFALAGSYDGATFLATSLFDAESPGTSIVLAAGTAGAGSNPPSAGTTGNEYLWTATAGGDWGDTANWQDVTTGGMPTAVAPGSADSVTITSTIAGQPYNASLFQIISGQGNVATLTTGGDVALGGIFQSGSITIGDASTLDVVSSSTLSAGSVSFGNGGLLQAMGGSLTIAGQIDGAGGALFAGNHATVQLAGGFLGLGFVGLDATAIIEVGNSGTASPGTLTIDPDATFGLATVPGTIVVAPNVVEPFTNVDGPVLNNGTITGGTYGSIVNNGIVENAVVNSGVNNNLIIDGTVSNLTGSGTLEVSGLNPVLTIGAGVDNGVGLVSANGTIILTTTSATPAITGYGTGDVLIDQAATAADTGVWTSGAGGIGTLTLLQGTASLAALSLVGDYSSSTFFVTNGTVSLTPPPPVTCFGAGTRIRTPLGDVAVETLRPGDEVVTLLQPSPQRVRWVGYRRIDMTRDPRPADNLPVCVRAGAFADGLPRRDLLLSPARAVYVEGVLIPVKRLINGTSVRQIDVASITYWHVELDRHDVLLAEGLPAESYLDTGDRAAFANVPVVMMRPDFQALTWEAQGCAPLVVTGAELLRARALLQRRQRMVKPGRADRTRAA